MLFSAVNQDNENEKAGTQTPEEAEKTNRQIKILSLIVAAVAAALALYYLSVNVLAPTNNYNNGIRAMQEGRFEEAIADFTAAGTYKDAADQLASCRQKLADFLAGKENAVSYVTSAMAWTSISETGEYGFNQDTYEKGQKFIPDYGNVVIPDVLDGILVRSIKEKTFLNADMMTSVVIPDAVSAIPDSCFWNCTSLYDIRFGKNVSSIAQRAFLNCTALTEISLPETVTAIGLRAFNNCTSLKKAEIRGSVTNLMPYTFSECWSLREISLPASIETIHENAFTGCGELEIVYFAGSQSDWEKIVIMEGNEALLNAAVRFAK